MFDSQQQKHVKKQKEKILGDVDEIKE